MGLFSKISEAVNDAVDWASDQVEDLAGDAQDAAGKAADWAGDQVESALESLQDGTNLAGAFDDAVDGLQELVNGGIDAAQDWVEDLPDWVVPVAAGAAIAIGAPMAGWAVLGADAAAAIATVAVPTGILVGMTDLETALVGGIETLQNGLDGLVDSAQSGVSNLLGRLDDGLAVLADSSEELGDVVRDLPEYAEAGAEAVRERLEALEDAV